jgi:TPR repeat protein
MSPSHPSREETFGKLFHVTAEKYWKGYQKTAGLLDAEGEAALAALGFTVDEFFAFLEDFVGVTDDSIDLYQKAAAQGDLLAQRSLGYIYMHGLGTVRDEALGLHWYRQAAERGDAASQNVIGYAYASGEGLAQDYAQAVLWYRKAAEQGEINAQAGLGYLYANGFGVDEDNTQAAFWYRKAAEAGSAYAQFYLAYQYRDGLGVPKDKAEAIFWFRKAAQSNAYAVEELARLESPGPDSSPQGAA